MLQMSKKLAPRRHKVFIKCFNKIIKNGQKKMKQIPFVVLFLRKKLKFA